MRSVWPWSGSYAREVVGESFFAPAIAALPWPEGFDSAVVLCSADLVHTPENAHDILAIAVLIDGKQVGHLSRDEAKTYHSRIEEVHLPTLNTSCNAIVVGTHLDTSDPRWSVQLDLSFDDTPSLKISTLHPNPIGVPNLTPVFTKTDGYGFATANWLPLSTIEACYPGHSLKLWRKPDSDSLFLFAQGCVGGQGRVLVVTDELLSAYGFSSVDQFEPRIYSVGRREVTVFFKLPTAR